MDSRRTLSLRGLLAGFYSRRILRIMPALFCCLLVTGLASAMFIPVSWLDRSIENSALAAFFGLSNFSLAAGSGRYFSPVAELNPFLHTWSLAVEEQFYLIFPFLFYIWLRGERRSLLAGIPGRCLLPVLTLLSLAAAVYATSRFRVQAFFLLPARFWEISLGILIFIQHSKGRLRPTRRLVSAVLISAGFLIGAAGFILAEAGNFPFPWVFLPVSAAALLICGSAGGAGTAGLPGRLLASRPMIWLGKRSYSIYLWHWPLAVLLRWSIGFQSPAVKLSAAAVSLLLAAASYRFIEEPCRRGAFFTGLRRPVLFASAGRCPDGLLRTLFSYDRKQGGFKASA